MLRAIIVSFFVHFSIVYLVPSVQILPSDFKYIEVEDVWLEPIEEMGQEEIGDRDLQSEDEIQERPQLDSIPTDLDAVEPDMLEERSPAAEWDTAFIGIDPRLPNNLKTPTQVKQFNSHATQPILPLREILSPEDITKQLPESEVIEAEPDMQPRDDVSLTAEQRYEDIIRSQTLQIPDEEISPGFTKLQPPEILESKSQGLVPRREIERNFPDIASFFMSRGEIPLDKWDKHATPSVRLPGRQEISEQTEDVIVVTADKAVYLPEIISPASPDDRLTLPEFPLSILQFSSIIKEVDTPPISSDQQKRMPEISNQPLSSRPFGVPLAKIHVRSETEKPSSLSQDPFSVSFPTAPSHPNIKALTERFDFHDNTKDEMEILPRTVVPEKPSIPQLLHNVEEGELVTAAPPRTLRSPQDIPVSPIVFPRTSETKLTLVKDAFAAEKVEIESEEAVVEAVAQPLLQKRLNQREIPPPFADEPRSVSISRDVQNGRHPFDQAQDRLKGGAHLIPQPQRIEIKRSFVIGGEPQDDMVVSPRSRIGIVVKEETLPQTQEPDVTLQEDDALERIAAEEVDASSFAIEGPASKREVLYKPTQLPDVHIDIEVDIRLKFWVLPDGSVGEVIPLQRGDVRLERAAIEYLKNWRFTPVAPDRPQVWGIIPIKYKFQ